jgi:hypothetical protein
LNVYILVIVWFVGAAVAGFALFSPDYSVYLVAGITGWVTVGGATAFIIYEIKRIRSEDKKKSEVA